MLLNRARSSLSVSWTNVRNSSSLRVSNSYLLETSSCGTTDHCMISARFRRCRRPSSPRPGADRHSSELEDPISRVRVSGQVEPTMVQLSQALLQGRQVQMALFARVQGCPELVNPGIGDARAVGVHYGRVIFGLSWLLVAGREVSSSRAEARRNTERMAAGEREGSVDSTWGMRSVVELGVQPKKA
jgi:hypothetical protein